jgi:hypothetical protein
VTGSECGWNERDKKSIKKFLREKSLVCIHLEVTLRCVFRETDCENGRLMGLFRIVSVGELCYRRLYHSVGVLVFDLFFRVVNTLFPYYFCILIVTVFFILELYSVELK